MKQEMVVPAKAYSSKEPRFLKKCRWFGKIATQHYVNTARCRLLKPRLHTIIYMCNCWYLCQAVPSIEDDGGQKSEEEYLGIKQQLRRGRTQAAIATPD